MKRKHFSRTRHIHAAPNEWVHVDRSPSSSIIPTVMGGWVAKAAAVVVGLMVALWIIQQILPWLIFGAFGWVLLQFFGKR